LLGQAISLPEISRSRVIARNALTSGRMSWSWQGEPKGLTCKPTVVSTTFQDAMLIEGLLDSDRFTAHIERPVVASLLRRIDPDITVEAVSPETAALLLEHAVEELISHCEAISGKKLSLTQVISPAPPIERDELGLEFVWAELGPAFLAVRGPHPVYEALFAFARSLAIDFGRVSALTSQISIRLATTLLSAAELASLMPGDMLVIDRSELSSVVLVSNEYALAPAQINGTKIRISSAFQCGRYGNLGEFIMSGPPDTGPAQPIARLADMPIKIAFELGRLDVPLAELASAGEGHVFILPTPLNMGCALVAGGAVIGRGEVVKVGEQFAVRVTSLVPR
jgi:type III secretion protein Q